MRRIGVILAVVAFALFGCSADDEPEPTDASPTTATDGDDSDRTSSEPARDQVVTSSAPAATTTEAASPTSSAAEAPDDPPVETTSEAAPPAPPPAPDPCAADTLSHDLLGVAGGIGVFVCEQGWAYAYHVGGTGDAEFVAQHQNGEWVQIAGLGSPTCQEELMERGAPRSVVVDFMPCERMYPPEEPTEPVADCVIPTEQYGATYATLYNIGCDQAAEQFYSAAENYPPSFDQAIITPNGWECWVFPQDPSYAVAGSCHAPDGSAEFILNVQSY